MRTACAATSGVCSAGLASTRVTGGQCSGDLTAENRQREVPRADADYRAQWAVGVVGEIVTRLRGVITQEVDGFTHFRRWRWRKSCRLHGPAGPSAAGSRLPSGRRHVRGSRHAPAGGVACQIGPALMAHWIALSTSSTVASCTWPTTSRRSDGFSTGRSGFIAGGATQHRRGFPVVVRGGQQGA